MDTPPVLAALAVAISWIVAPGASAEAEMPECVVPERLEIFSDVVDAELEARGMAPLVGCDTGPWRTFGSLEWPLSETHADFIAAVPEPRGAPLAAALASLILIAWRGRRPQPPAGTVGSQKMR